MNPRRPLIVLLSLGVIFGFGSAFAQAHHRMHGGGGCHDRFGEHAQWEERYEPRFAPPAPAPLAAPQPQTVIVQPAAPAAAAPAPAPQIFVIMPGAAAPVPAQIVQVPAPVAAHTP
jgi:hypothetical protein